MFHFEYLLLTFVDIFLLFTPWSWPCVYVSMCVCACVHACVCTLSSLAVPWHTGKSVHYAERQGVVCAGEFFPCVGQVHNSPHNLWVPVDLRKA